MGGPKNILMIDSAEGSSFLSATSTRHLNLNPDKKSEPCIYTCAAALSPKPHKYQMLVLQFFAVHPTHPPNLTSDIPMLKSLTFWNLSGDSLLEKLQDPRPRASLCTKPLNNNPQITNLSLTSLKPEL